MFRYLFNRNRLCCNMRKNTAEIIALLSMLCVTNVCAQEIEYNLDPTHEIKNVQWKLPIGGKLNANTDVSKILIASIHDSVFYMLHTQSLRIDTLPIRFTRNNDDGHLFYRVSSELKYLVTRLGFTNDSVSIFDLTSGTLVSRLPIDDRHTKIGAISSKHDVVVWFVVGFLPPPQSCHGQTTERVERVSDVRRRDRRSV